MVEGDAARALGALREKASPSVSLQTDWEAIRDRYEFYHKLCSFGSLAGLTCTFVSVL